MIPTIEMGEKIKALRKQRKITQEQFANYLKISFQAVSKWERGDAYPDITMLPRIATFFNTTTDELLCVDRFKIEHEIDDYIAQKDEAGRLGQTEKALEIMREANEKYPGNYKLMANLMYSISWNDNKRNEEERRLDNLEIIDIAERIRAECPDNSIKKDVLQHLCYSYKSVGEKQKALNLIETEMTSFYVSQEVMKEHILDGDEYAEQLKWNTYAFFESVLFCMWRYSNTLIPEEQIKLCEKAIALNEVMYPGELYDHIVFHLHHTIGQTYLENNNFPKALEYFRKETDHTIRKDKEWTPSPSHVYAKNSTGNASCWLMRSFDSDFYDPIRETEEFKKIIEDLKQYARDDV